MKIGVYSDVHLTEKSSIVRGVNGKYTDRLQKCIDSVNFAEEELKDCDIVIINGDFFDNAHLTALEVTAFSDIKWNDKKHIVLCGNHEMGRKDLEVSSAHLFKLLPNFTLITEPTSIDGILYLPYGYGMEYYKGEKIVFSHNDVKGINLGGYITQHGIDLNDIDCFFVNGHIHNGTELKKNVFNIGNLVGQNFSEDAFKYEHRLMKIDYDTLEYEFIENPHSFNFYKLTKISELKKIKDNAIVTVKTSQKDLTKWRKALEKESKILYTRIITEVEQKEVVELEKVDLSVDHIALFRDYIAETLGENGLKELESII